MYIDTDIVYLGINKNNRNKHELLEKLFCAHNMHIVFLYNISQ